MTRVPARPIALTGADCFLRAFHRDCMRAHGAGHLSQLVLRLGPDPGGADADGFRARLEGALAAVAQANPIVRAPIARPWLVLPAVYRADRAGTAPLPRVALHAEVAAAAAGARSGSAAALPREFETALNAPMAIERGELLRADIVPYGPRGEAGLDVALTWAHMLLDGSGSEAFVRLLDGVAAGTRDPDDVPEADRLEVAAETKPRGPFREWSRKAQTWQQHVGAMAERAPRSLAGPQRRVRQELRYAVSTFERAETEAVQKRAASLGGVLTPMLFYLAAAVRAHAEVFEARGVDPGSYVVPVPVNLRPKGDDGGIFRTRVSMFWFQVLSEHAGSLEDCVAELKRQRHALIKAGGVENGVAAMDLVRPMPSRLYAAMARRTLRGELCSFFFAWTGEFLPGMGEFLGRPIENAFHTPSVPPSPGSGVILSVRDGCLNAGLVDQSGAVTDSERERLRAALREALVGSASAP